MRGLLLRLLPLLALGLTSCKASVQADLNAQSEADGQDFNEPLSDRSGDVAPPSEFEGEIGNQALMGARHDLTLAGDNPAPSCSCLAVTVGFPTNPAFFWQANTPSINPDTQLVIAFTSEGIACPNAPADSLGASYWGFKQSGDDIIVVIENAAFGRPITQGAIIPRPMGNGAVYVEPLNSKVPYGRPASGSGNRCQVPLSTGTTGLVVPPPPGTTPAAAPPPAAAPAAP